MLLLGFALGILGTIAFVAFLFATAPVAHQDPERGFVFDKQPSDALGNVAGRASHNIGVSQ